MMSEETDIQARVNLMKLTEAKAVQGMLLIALQHGFQIQTLIELARDYQTSAAVLEYFNDECTVYYATEDGYFTKKFEARFQEACDFAETFDSWWYQ